jgi:hypothetical protein
VGMDGREAGGGQGDESAGEMHLGVLEVGDEEDPCQTNDEQRCGCFL